MNTNAYENAKYIGITDHSTGEKTVHLPTCEKYVLMHGIQFDDLESAHNEGYENCPECIGKIKG